MTRAHLWILGTLLAGAILIATLLILFGEGKSTTRHHRRDTGAGSPVRRG